MMELTPRQIITELLNSEHELKTFCSENNLHLSDKEHTWSYVIEAFIFLSRRFGQNGFEADMAQQTFKHGSPTRPSQLQKMKSNMFTSIGTVISIIQL